MKLYSFYGFNDYIICAGYRQNIIKEYFSKYALNHGDIEVNLETQKVKIIRPPRENWKVTVVDTGPNTMTGGGGRIKRIEPYLDSEENFMFTYGDGVADINITELLQYHRKHSPILTLTAVQPPGRFGSIQIDDQHEVTKFTEKPLGDGQWINAGFYVASRKIFDEDFVTASEDFDLSIRISMLKYKELPIKYTIGIMIGKTLGTGKERMLRNVAGYTLISFKLEEWINFL